MKTIHSFSLQHNNSFAVKSTTPTIYYPETISDLNELTNKLPAPYYILGEGSNTLFIEDEAPVIIKPEFLGIEVAESDYDYQVTAACAENWHQLVCFCIDKGINGLENLALIPGSVGAAPVQNIGAYGVEVSDYITQVSWFDFQQNKIRTLTKNECQFSYRNSLFKQALKGKGLITSVTFSFPKNWQAKLGYQGLDELSSSSGAKAVMEKVISIRHAKLPDPNVLANAGSFFKNPIISQQAYQQLSGSYPDMPHYPQKDGSIKIAAGWLIEQTGLKGYKESGVGVHEKQALVLVNYSSTKGYDIQELAQRVRKKVYEMFSIDLEAEVRIISAQGEASLEVIK
jgi:UDP-N-acetylmuramate dehydrogenase